MKRWLLLWVGAGLACSGLGWCAAQAQTERLYSLNTTCSLGQGKPQPCQVEVVEVGETTEYRHQLGARTISYRILDDPYVRIEGRKSAGAPWASVRNAWINFITNELCFNNRAFCVVNPAFLADVKAEAQGPAFEGRETVGLAFGEGGRVDVACFDNGCRRLLEAIGR